MMKMVKTATASAAMALVMAGASAASATVFNLDVYDAGFNGSLGTVTVTGEGTNTLAFDVLLNPTVFFQMTGNGSAHDAFWFDLNKQTVGGGTTSFTNSVTFGISAPNGAAPGSGDYPTGGRFTALRDLNHFGQGWSSGYDYGLQVSDSSAGGGLNYYTGHLTFTVASNDGSLLSLDPSTHDGHTVFGGADLRQCPTTNPTSGSCVTGPVGFAMSAVPEPNTWLVMLLGFAGLGAALRYRRQQAPVVA